MEKVSTALHWVPVRNERVRLRGAFGSTPGTAEAQKTLVIFIFLPNGPLGQAIWLSLRRYDL